MSITRFNIHSCLMAALLLLGVAMTTMTTSAQIVVTDDRYKFDADSIRREFDSQPFFSLHKDNYFIVGTSVGPKPTTSNSNIKFQISIQQRLTKSVLPFHSYLYLFYSQKAIWNIFQESLPFYDLNFNPGIGLSKMVIMKGRLVGKLTLLIEHESNGRDGLEDRSWNKVSLAGEAYIDPQFMVHAKYWIPLIDSKHNKDILKYSGIYQTGCQFMTLNDKWVFDVTLVKRQGWNLNFNTIVQAGFRINHKSNQFLMLQYYNGYGECLLDYNKYKSELRVGLLIRPKFFSDF